VLLVAAVPVNAAAAEVTDDYVTVLEDSDDSENQLDVLRNDAPPDDLRIVGVTQGAHGAVDILGQELVTYQPAPNYWGSDQFRYAAATSSGRIFWATVYVTVRGINDRPNARDDSASTNEDQSVAIDVLDNDTDIDGDIDPATVTRVSGPTHGEVTINAGTGVATYHPTTDWHGTDTFTYRVCDDGTPLPALCDQANVQITVRPVSDPPIADAGPDQTSPTLSTVTLDGAGSYDPDGDVTLSYEWLQTGGSQQVILSDPAAASPTFVAPDDPDSLVFSLVVYDNVGQPSANTDTTRITITNQSPIAHAGIDQSAYTGVLVTLDGSASYDPDHDALTYEWAQTGGPTVALSSATAVSPTFRAPASVSRLSFALQVRDAFDARSLHDQVEVDVIKTPIHTLHLPLVPAKHALLPDLVVKTLSATRNNVQVIVENRGDSPLTQGFYVDVYVNPLRPPVGAHEGWDTDGISTGRGLVWAIDVRGGDNPSTGTIAPLVPGDTLTLNVGDDFYVPEYSVISWPLAVGTTLYAQVDSFPSPTPHSGLVLESHEYLDQAYNNITGPVSSSSVAGSVQTALPGTHSFLRSHRLPLRP
jgi:hypothetical protein